jgi:PAS domain S-box-containing protein
MSSLTTAPVSVLSWLLDKDGTSVSFSDNGSDFLGRSLDGEARQAWVAAIHPDDLEACSAAFRAAFDGRRPLTIEVRLRRFDGEYRSMLASGAPLHDQAGDFSGYCVTCVDITEHRDATTRLAEVEERYRMAVTASGIGVWEWDLGEKVTWTPTLEAIYGIPPGSFPGTFEAFVSRLHPQDRDRIAGLVAGALAQRADLDFEERILRSDGEVRWLRSRATLVLNADGTPRRMVGTCIDITERKRYELDLQESQARSQAVLDAAVNGIVTIDDRGIIESVNPAAQRLFGYTAEEMLGNNVSILMPAPYRLEHDGYIERYQRTGERRIIGTVREVEGRRKDGSTFPMELSVSEVLLQDRRIFTGVINDISGRRRAEERLALLASSSAILHASLDYESTLKSIAQLLVPALADWFVVHIDEDGELKQLLVWHRDADMLNWVQELQKKYPPSRDPSRGVYHVWRTGESEIMPVIPQELLRAAAVDEEHWEIIQRLGLVSYICVPLLLHGDVLGTLALVAAESGRTYDDQDLQLALELGRRVARAIENARLFRESELARSELERSNRAKDEFLGIVSHELRTPLSTIYGSARFATQHWEGLDDGTLRELMGNISSESNRMSQMVENLLLLARLEMGKRPERNEVSVADVVKRTVDTLKPLSPDRDVRFQVPEDATLTCVETYVEQMLFNLLTNANKYSPADQPIDVSVRREGEYLVFRVLDRGPGVPTDELRLLFDSFYRSPSVQDRLPGKGLGLAVCRRLAEVQGGRVWAAQRSGGGLEVGFALPVEASAPIAC